MLWPRPRACFNDSKTVSTACSAFVRLMFVVATTAFTMSNLITQSSRASEADARGCGLGCQDGRSEEHTSELQSRLHLVCRLLLEKKKRRRPSYNHTSYRHAR